MKSLSDFVISDKDIVGELTYGGKNRRRWWLPQYLYVDEPGDIPKQCETMNGNCVLIPDEVAKCVGNLDPIFVHSMGDGDYGYRARYAGFKLWIAPGYIGYCSRNTMFHLSKSDQSSVLASLKRVCEPKAVPPNAWYHYTKRHYGFFWPIFCFLPYAMAIFRALRAKFSS